MEMLILLLVVPLSTSLLFWAAGENKKLLNILNITGSALLLAVSIFTVGEVLDKGQVSAGFLNGILYVDSFNALIIFVTALVSFLAALYSTGYMNEELKRKVIDIKRLRLYYSLMHAFIFTMMLTASVQNMGLMWIAIEATTLASAFLVGFYNNKKSIEAAWKYIIICSVGIAFAMLGIILLYYSSVKTLGNSMQGMNWKFLFDNAGSLQGNILKLSFIFVLLGFGTKAGLAPMHTWLPDAHSQAPSPISALLSGVLLNTAMYGIIRVMIIVNKNLQNKLFTGRLLLIFGLLSIGTAAVFVLVQQDFKRTLAYSSIEHMGIIALGFGISTPLGIFGALYHVLNHSLTKSMLFLSSGNVYLRYETKKISKVKGILKTMPVTGTVFLLGLFAIVGMPPFSIFSSELSIITAAFKSSNYLAAALVLVFLTLVFMGIAVRMLKMFYGEPSKDHGKGEIGKLTPVVLIVLLILIGTTGLYLPGPLSRLLDGAVNIINTL